MHENLLATLIGLLTLLGLVPAREVAAERGASGEARPSATLVVPDRDAVDQAAAASQLPTAGDVDPARYTGLWYELARLPVPFQDARSVSTARYTGRDDGVIGVENTSLVGDEQGYRIDGTARPVTDGRYDRLAVSFGGFLSFVPVADEGNYWIIAVADDYSTALVGTPDRRFLWLLARDAQPADTSTAQSYIDRAGELGFDTTRLQIADWERRVMPG